MDNALRQNSEPIPAVAVLPKTPELVPAVPVIDLDGLSVTFGGRPILRDLRGELRGRAIGLLGPNGAGKTTLIHTLLGFHQPSSGTAHIFGRDIRGEAKQMLAAAQRSGAMHGYAETEVFAPAVVKARETIEKGGIGRVLWVRSRESHSGPHSPHFWDVDQTGGGALSDLGCHCVEAARYFFGKEDRIVEVMA